MGGKTIPAARVELSPTGQDREAVAHIAYLLAAERFLDEGPDVPVDQDPARPRSPKSGWRRKSTATTATRRTSTRRSRARANTSAGTSFSKGSSATSLDVYE